MAGRAYAAVQPGASGAPAPPPGTGRLPESATIPLPSLPHRRFPHALRRHRHLHRHARPHARGQRGDHARAPAARQGRARHRQDDAGGRGRARARPAAPAVAHQVDDQGAAGPLRIRRRVAAARFAARRRARRRHRALHQARRAVGGVRSAGARGRADRRGRQGRHRVSERPAARARPHGVLRLRDAADDPRDAPAARGHHVEQREGAAGRVPAPLLLPLHPLSRPRDDDADRRRALSRASRRRCSPRRWKCSSTCARCRA